MPATTSHARPRPEFESWWKKIRAMAAQGQLLRALLGGGPGYFRSPVRWLLGRDLLAQASSILLYSAFANELDHRDWMYPEEVDLSSDGDASDEFWFDYLADSGDGQLAVYSVAYLALGDVWVDDATTEPGRRAFTSAMDPGATKTVHLPRGRFLFVGGDTAYHVGDHATLEQRFSGPFNWAHADRKQDTPAASVPEPKRLLFAIPGNHDYYDSLAGFNRQFRAPCAEHPPLPIADFVRQQQASFTALKLPFDWLFCGLDSQAGKLSFRQTRFFQEILGPLGCARRLIVATPEPTTVFGSVDQQATKPFIELRLPRPFFPANPAKNGGAPSPGARNGALGDRVPRDCLHLDLAGDVHHYARYFGPDAKGNGSTNYASVVAGGGGAFLHPSQTDVHRHRSDHDAGLAPQPNVQYPSPDESRQAVSPALLLPWRIANGGFVWLIGGLLSLIATFALLVAPSTHFLFEPVQRLATLVGSFQHLRPSDTPAPISPGLGYVVDHVLKPGQTTALSGRCLPDATELAFIGVVAALLIAFGIITVRLMQRAHERKTLVFSQGYLGALLLLVAAVGVIVVGYRMHPPPVPEHIHPLRASVLVLAYVIMLPLAIAWSLRYVTSLALQARRRAISGLEYLPVWTVLIIGVVAAGFGVFRHGGHAVGELVSDMMSITVLLGLLVGIPLAGAFVGAERLRARGKVAVGLLGLWLGLLILLVPLLLAAYGGAGNLVAIGALLAAASAIGWKSLTRQGQAWPLLVSWLLVGAGVVVAAAWNPVARPPSWWHLLLAAIAGAALSCVWFGWYLATALAFDAHNNEAGGAARVQDYKHLLRIRLRKDELTVFALGIPKVAMHGRDLKPVLVDTFTLKPS